MSCPKYFELTNTGNTCVYKCPSAFEYRENDKGRICAYKADDNKFFRLPPIGVTASENEFRTLRREMQKEEAKITREVGKEPAEETAFKAMMAAEAVQDIDPEGYQRARNEYYTLTEGETWKAKETERIQNSEAAAMANQYLQEYKLKNQAIDEVKNLYETVKNIRDKVFSDKDTVKYAVTELGTRIMNMKNDIAIERRKTDEVREFTSQWITTILDGLIILAAVIACGLLFFKMFLKSSNSTPYSSSFAQRYG